MTTDQQNLTDALEDALITERDMLGALEVLQSAVDEPDMLMELTDEEILGLDGKRGLTLLGSPYLDSSDIDERSASAAVLRSLMARRLITRPGDEQEPEGDIVSGDGDPSARPVQFERRLAGVLALRKIPEALVTVHRTLSGGSTTLAFYLFPEGGVLEEFISTDGFHSFSVPTLAAVPDRLVRFVDPFEDASTDGESKAVPADSSDADFEVEGTRAMSVVTASSPDGGYQATVFALEGRARVLDNGPIQDDPAPQEKTIGDVSRESLRAMLTALIPVATSEDDAPEA